MLYNVEATLISLIFDAASVGCETVVRYEFLPLATSLTQQAISTTIPVLVVIDCFANIFTVCEKL